MNPHTTGGQSLNGFLKMSALAIQLLRSLRIFTVNVYNVQSTILYTVRSVIEENSSTKYSSVHFLAIIQTLPEDIILVPFCKVCQTWGTSTC